MQANRVVSLAKKAVNLAVCTAKKWFYSLALKALYLDGLSHHRENPDSQINKDIAKAEANKRLYHNKATRLGVEITQQALCLTHPHECEPQDYLCDLHRSQAAPMVWTVLQN